MKRSTDRVLTTHVGSLPRPPALQNIIKSYLDGQAYDEAELTGQIQSAVSDVVRQQADAGVDIPSDGEQSKTGFLLYGNDRLSGFEQVEIQPDEPRRAPRRDEQAFPDFYAAYYQTEGDQGPRKQPLCTGPISYTGHSLVQQDIENFRSALNGVETEEAFLPAIAPGTFGRGQNGYYPDEEAFLYAIADAIKEEYKAIVDAGFLLQIDDPGLPDTWDMQVPALSVEEYRKLAVIRIDALNHALEGIPEDRIRYHICWGSWHGPHSTDIPLKDIVDLVLRVNAGGYSIEAANPRHEHEWKVWEDVKLPEGKVLVPGVISHSTNHIEHPELVAQRITNFASVVGVENLVAGTDCGFSQRALNPRLHPSIVWAKLQALSDGAKIASKQLFG
jgi:5-methyltetrahydropteroyltriglutamate--homocysteine methyltransferase